MYEMFDAQLQKAFNFARQEAIRSNYPYISSSHLLLGISKLGLSTAVTLEKQNITLKKLREAVEIRIKQGKEYVEIKNWPLTGNAQTVISQAIKIAQADDRDLANTDDLLQAICEKEGCSGEVMLRDVGFVKPF